MEQSLSTLRLEAHLARAAGAAAHLVSAVEIESNRIYINIYIKICIYNRSRIKEKDISLGWKFKLGGPNSIILMLIFIFTIKVIRPVMNELLLILKIKIR